ncbi:MAG: glycosyltransferase family 4 protein [Candidatus Binataceae bacterium]
MEAVASGVNRAEDWSAANTAALVGSPPLSVIGVDPERGFGGGETQVLGLTLALRAAGIRAELACDPDGALAQRAHHAGVRCHPLRIRNSIDVGAGLRLRMLLERERFDVVHFHTARAHALAPYAYGGRRALVVTRRMDYVPNRLFAKWLYERSVDGIAAISTPVAAALSRAGVASERITIIPSGVDCERFSPASESVRTRARAALGLREDEVAIGTVAALEPRKGHRLLLEAIARLAGHTGTDAIRCFIAGAGSMRTRLLADIERLEIAPLINLMGYLDDPRQLLSALDIFVLPSLNEGLGVAALEAMASALPAVVSNSGGLAELVEDGRTGYKFASGDVCGLARAIARLTRERARGRLGMAARAMIVERFGMEAMARRTLELYRTCLDKVRHQHRSE